MSENNLYAIVLGIYVAVLFPDLLKIFRLFRNHRFGTETTISIKKSIIKINTVILFFSIILFLLNVSFEVNIFNYSKPIAYSKISSISLDDFNGFNLKGHKLQGDHKFAFIVTSISYSISEEGIEVVSKFHPARSYVYIDNLKDSKLLTHELYHFRITEIWARIFREKLTKFEHQPSNSVINDLYENIKKSEREMQVAYDYGSDHGFLLGKQLKWQHQTDSLLAEYLDYENTLVYFTQ